MRGKNFKYFMSYKKILISSSRSSKQQIKYIAFFLPISKKSLAT